MSNQFILQPAVDVEVPTPLMAWLVQFAEFAGEAKMGLQCTLCKTAIVGGGHGLHDATLTMRCACRTFTGVNPNVLIQKRKLEQQTQALKDGSADLSVS